MQTDSSIVVRVADHFLIEKEYIANVFFEQILGVPFSIVVDPKLQTSYQFQIEDKLINFKDDFFCRVSENSGYLSALLIPDKVEFSKNEFIFEKDIPVLFGNTLVVIADNKIEVGHDIFASVFFMLARWEEVVMKERDYLERFPGKASLAFRNGILHRPLVNEIAEMVKKMIQYLSPGFIFKKPQPFEIVFTHDIDFLNAPVSVREFAKDILKRKRPSAFFKRLQYFFTRSNPYDLFDLFMNVSEKWGTRSHFYFMTGHNLAGRDGQSYNSSRNYKRVLKKIADRRHIIGFHPSLLSYNDPEMFIKEKKILESDISEPVKIGRQHALRFTCPDTWQMWEDNGMEIDSTMGYSDNEGFRCGTGCSFSVFNVAERKMLKLKEMPLVLMDTTLHVNRKLSVSASSKIIHHYIDIGKRFDMPVTFLFHNLLDDSIDWNGWKKLYEDIFLKVRDE